MSAKKKQAAKKVAAVNNTNTGLQTLTQPVLLDKCKEILTEYMRSVYQSATSVDEIMDNYPTDESCKELIEGLSKSQKEYFVHPNNYLYDVMCKNNLRGFVGLCIRNMFASTIQTEVPQGE